MKKCLWIIPKLIFPVSDEARLANRSLLGSVRPHFEQLDIIVYKEEYEKNIHLELYHEHFKPNNVHVLIKPNTATKIKKFFSLLFSILKYPTLPLATRYFSTSYCKKEIKKILKATKYDVLVFDGIHPYSAFLDLEKEGILPPIVYRAHNVEHELLVSAAEETSNPLKRLVLLWQSQKMAILEKKIIEKAKKVWVIANEDQRRFIEMTGKEHIHHIPIGLNFIKENIFSEEQFHAHKIKLLFVGKMDWAPHIDGLRWFFHEIWPFVDHKKLEIKIVGGGESSWAESFYIFPGVTFLGQLKDDEIATLYEETDYSIVPVRFSSGMNLKLIESISHAVPIISTPVGVFDSGLEEDEYIKATDAQEWISVLNSLVPDYTHERVRSAFSRFEKTYSSELIGENAYLSLQT